MEFEDLREQIMNEISEEELASIKETFQLYDINSDGGISKAEMLRLVRARSRKRKEVIEERFNDFVAGEQERYRRLQESLEAQAKREQHHPFNQQVRLIPSPPFIY